MNISDYANQALRSEKKGEAEFIALTGVHFAAARALVFAGALADTLKKAVIYGRPTDDLREDVEALMESVLALSLEVRREKRGEINSRLDRVYNLRLLHSALGIFGEAAELLEADPEDLVNVGEELGDTAWYLALGLDELQAASGGQITPEAVLQANIRKLQQRYPDKFSVEASEARDVVAERAVLEQMS